MKITNPNKVITLKNYQERDWCFFTQIVRFLLKKLIENQEKRNFKNGFLKVQNTSCLQNLHLSTRFRNSIFLRVRIAFQTRILRFSGKIGELNVTKYKGQMAPKVVCNPIWWEMLVGGQSITSHALSMLKKSFGLKS